MATEVDEIKGAEFTGDLDDPHVAGERVRTKTPVMSGPVTTAMTTQSTAPTGAITLPIQLTRFRNAPSGCAAVWPCTALLVAALEGALEVGALGALGAGLFSIGIPKDSIVKYEAALKTDQFLLIAHGTAAEVARAKDIIETTHPAQFTLHPAGKIAA